MGLPPLPGVERLGAAGKVALEAAAVSLGVEPRELAAVVSVESSFRTAEPNPTTGAMGLIQWLPEVAAALHTTTDEIAAMTAAEQCALIVRTLAPHRAAFRRLGDVYIAVVVPGYLGRPDSAVWAAAGTARYERNKGLDADHDGQLTIADLRARIVRELAQVAPAVPAQGERRPRAIGGELAVLAVLAVLGAVLVKL